MVDINLYNVKSVLKIGLVHIALIYPITKNNHFRLLKPLKITLSNGADIVIPKDFEFDGRIPPGGS